MIVSKALSLCCTILLVRLCLKINVCRICGYFKILTLSDHEVFSKQFRYLTVLAQDKYEILKGMAFRPVLL